MKNPFRFPNRPGALSLEDWDKFYEQMKHQYPIRYFMNQVLAPWWHRNIVRPINDFVYFVKCHVHPRYRFHKLDIRQYKNREDCYGYRFGWIDADTQMLFALMNILCNFIEKEKGGLQNCFERIDFLAEEKEKEDRMSCYDWDNAIKEEKDMIAIYQWWKKDRKIEWDRLQIILMSDDKNYKEYFDLENAFYDRDAMMMKALIDLRGGMWT